MVWAEKIACEFYYYGLRGRVGASKVAMLTLVNDPSHRHSCEFFEMCIDFGTDKVVHFESS